jgi:hypothetical protein
VTWLTLHTLSRPRFAFFTPRRAAITDLIPLSVAMCLNVILPNLSLAFSSVTFYQIARILLTPTVALMNFVLYRAVLPRSALLALVPACLGVGMVSYYDSLPSADANVKTTSPLGVVFAFSGIFASSLYTVWIASYHRKLQMSSMQLLHNQAPIASFLLLYAIPFIDTFPDWAHVPVNRWVMILMVSPPPQPHTPPLALCLCTTSSRRDKKLTQKRIVRLLRFPHQHLPILHHRPDRSRLQHRRRPPQDLHHRRPRLDRLGPRHRRQVRRRRRHRHRRHHRLLGRHAPAKGSTEQIDT